MKGFLQQWKHEYAAFLSCVKGIAPAERQARYAAVTFSRLMFLCFLQQRGSAAGESHNPLWLAGKLHLCANQTPPRSFFRHFLVPLFEQELLWKQGAGVSAWQHIFGGTLPPNALPDADAESAISIENAAFERLFSFFDGFEWRIDRAASNGGNQLDPDLIGRVFEQCIDQKGTGSYYTSDDVAGYIAGSTIAPYVFDKVRRLLPAAFRADGPVWRYLRQQPERYIYGDVQKGVDLELPAEIGAWLHDVAGRERWNSLAHEDFGLPKETWRDHIARRSRCVELRARLATGELCDINALVTHNLDLKRFSYDVIAGGEEPELIWAFYQAVASVTVLDPTCGSGAFLLAALDVLEPLYEICLERMASMVAATGGDKNADQAQIDMFQTTLEQAAAPSNRRCFILQGIIGHNLYGVDLLPEAVEVCKLRLMLRLLAAGDGAAIVKVPENLAFHLRVANILADSAAPQSAFDVVIGNPPYLEYSKVKASYTVQGYRTERCGNLYAFVLERSLSLLGKHGRCGMIVPIASVSTNGMQALQELYAPYVQWHSHFAVRPGKLFVGVDMNLTVSLLCQAAIGPAPDGQIYSSGYRRWSAGKNSDRPQLFTTLAYVAHPGVEGYGRRYPKLGSSLEVGLLRRIASHGNTLGHYLLPGEETLYYHSGGRYWRKALPVKLSSHYKAIRVPASLSAVVFALLNSQLFYWYWISNSNCMDVVAREVLELPVFPLAQADPASFGALQAELLSAYTWGSSKRLRAGRRIHGEELQIDVQQGKPIIDAIDRLLAQHYGLNDEELDFILNYDIKYRMPIAVCKTSDP